VSERRPDIHPLRGNGLTYLVRIHMPRIRFLILEHQVIFGEDRKSMSGDYFSILVILILHRFDLALHASLMMIYLYSMFLLFLNK
jgi:hypothetical protein